VKFKKELFGAIYIVDAGQVFETLNLCWTCLGCDRSPTISLFHCCDDQCLTQNDKSEISHTHVLAT
jgi:hypothetical protein